MRALGFAFGFGIEGFRFGSWVQRKRRFRVQGPIQELVCGALPCRVQLLSCSLNRASWRTLRRRSAFMDFVRASANMSVVGIHRK